MSHVSDDLELYAVGALEPADRRRVDAHLGSCDACRAEASALAAVVDALPETVPDREPPAPLRGRILATARADAAPARTARWSWLRPARVRAAVLAASILAVAGIGAIGIADANAQLAEAREIAMRVSTQARTWYMAGTADEWRRSGATLFAPTHGTAFAVVRDLPDAPRGATYALWLVDERGRWVRAANFGTRGWSARLVDLGMTVDGYDRCAITLETSDSGRRSGPIVLQSQIYDGPAR